MDSPIEIKFGLTGTNREKYAGTFKRKDKRNTVVGIGYEDDDRAQLRQYFEDGKPSFTEIRKLVQDIGLDRDGIRFDERFRPKDDCGLSDLNRRLQSTDVDRVVEEPTISENDFLEFMDSLRSYVVGPESTKKIFEKFWLPELKRKIGEKVLSSFRSCLVLSH